MIKQTGENRSCISELAPSSGNFETAYRGTHTEQRGQTTDESTVLTDKQWSDSGHFVYHQSLDQTGPAKWLAG